MLFRRQASENDSLRCRKSRCRSVAGWDFRHVLNEHELGRFERFDETHTFRFTAVTIAPKQFGTCLQSGPTGRFAGVARVFDWDWANGWLGNLESRTVLMAS